jgi:septum formation protein
MGVTFETIPSQFAEQLDDSRSPEEAAMELAVGKAMNVAMQYPDAIVIGSDTIVTVDGKQLEKPVDDEDAYRMLTQLSGTSNDVSTSLAVIRLSDQTRFVTVDTARVYFRPYDEAAITKYIASGDTVDKAGAYGIQSGAAPLISHIEGHYDTIVGLPTILLADILERLGVQAKAVSVTPPVDQRTSP